MILAVMVAIGCGGSDLDSDETTASLRDSNRDRPASDSAAEEKTPDAADTGPTILGLTGELRDEIRAMISEAGGDKAAAEAAVDQCMEIARSTADAFGMKEDESGNIEWSDEFQKQIGEFRKKFDERKLVDEFAIQVPDWAASLVEQRKSDDITPQRRDLLFWIISAKIMKDLS